MNRTARYALAALLFTAGLAQAQTQEAQPVDASGPGLTLSSAGAHLKSWVGQPDGQFAMRFSGFNYRFKDSPSVKHEWNRENWGLGLEVRSAFDKEGWNGWTRKTAAGFTLDGTRRNSWYLGTGLEKRLYDGAVSVDAGAGVFLLYRHLNFNESARLIPAVLPSVSIEHKASHVGLNLQVMPNIRFSDSLNMPGAIYGHVTYAF